MQSCVKEKAFHHPLILFDVFAAADADIVDADAVTVAVVVVVVTSLLFNCW